MMKMIIIHFILILIILLIASNY